MLPHEVVALTAALGALKVSDIFSGAERCAIAVTNKLDADGWHLRHDADTIKPDPPLPLGPEFADELSFIITDLGYLLSDKARSRLTEFRNKLRQAAQT
jgi:hypothetical protein